MFSGIIEKEGVVRGITKQGSNYHFQISSDFISELYIDQSIAHNGVCLTVVSKKESSYVVTAIHETILKTNLSTWKEGTIVNLERCITPSTRLDGHYVQGHVDTTSKCLDIKESAGSWYFKFALPDAFKGLIVEKGSIAINGVSLTVVDLTDDSFKVAIIPYTYEHTNFKELEVNDLINLEFDILGKYVARNLKFLGK